MIVLCCGDRNWVDGSLIRREIFELDRSVCILNGGARGADTICADVARSLGMNVLTVNAQWDKYGKAAGPMRNLEMLRMSPSLVLAFHDNLDKSKGTKHCVSEALKRNIKVKVISHG